MVFNTLERGTWGAEERGSGVPSSRDWPFDVLLIATEEGFKVRLFHRAGSDTHVSSLGKARKAPGRGWEQRWLRLGRTSPVPHLPCAQALLVSESRRSSAKDPERRAKSPRWVSSGRCRASGFYSLSTGDRGSGSGAGEWMDWEDRESAAGGGCRSAHHPGSLHFQSAVEEAMNPSNVEPCTAKP